MPAFRFSAVCRGAQGSVARAQRRIQLLETPIPALVRSQQHRVVAYATHGDCQASSISGSFTPAINAGRVDRSVRCARSENGLLNFVFRFSMKYASEPEVRKQASALSGPIASFSKLDSHRESSAPERRARSSTSRLRMRRATATRRFSRSVVLPLIR